MWKNLKTNAKVVPVGLVLIGLGLFSILEPTALDGFKQGREGAFKIAADHLWGWPFGIISILAGSLVLWRCTQEYKGE